MCCAVYSVVLSSCRRCQWIDGAIRREDLDTPLYGTLIMHRQLLQPRLSYGARRRIDQPRMCFEPHQRSDGTGLSGCQSARLCVWQLWSRHTDTGTHCWSALSRVGSFATDWLRTEKSSFRDEQKKQRRKERSDSHDTTTFYRLYVSSMIYRLISLFYR